MVGYTLAITPVAEAQLGAFPEPLAQFVRSELTRLKENPTALSKPATILQPRGQLFEVRYDSGGVVVWVSVIFRFGQDEQTLYVEDRVAEFG